MKNLAICVATACAALAAGLSFADSVSVDFEGSVPAESVADSGMLLDNAHYRNTRYMRASASRPAATASS